VIFGCHVVHPVVTVLGEVHFPWAGQLITAARAQGDGQLTVRLFVNAHQEHAALMAAILILLVQSVIMAHGHARAIKGLGKEASIHARAARQPVQARLLARRQQIAVHSIARTAVEGLILVRAGRAALTLPIARQTLRAQVPVFAVPVLHARLVDTNAVAHVQEGGGSTDVTD